MCRKCCRAVSSLAAPAKKKEKKKSILLVFKHKHLTRIEGQGVDLCALAASRSNVHLWQVLSAESTATEPAVRFQSHYTICFSNLLLFSVDICSRGLCVWRGVLLFREKRRRGREARLRLPTSPRDPKPNRSRILNDFKVRECS